MLDWFSGGAPAVLLDCNEISLDRLWVGPYVLPELKTRRFDAGQARSYLLEHRDCDPYIAVLQRYALCLGPQDGG